MLRKFRPWREDLDWAILRLMETGHIDRVKLPALPYDPLHNPNLDLDADLELLSLMHLATAFMFLLAGLAIVLVAFACETAYHRKRLSR